MSIFLADIEKKVKQVHFISQVDQIQTALSEILKEPDRHIVHSCAKPEKPGDEPHPEPEPEEDPNSSITPEQLLSLMAEIYLQEVAEDQRDFKNKLMSACLENGDYQKAVQDVLQLQPKYLKKIQEAEKSGSTIDEKKEQDELNELKKKILDFIDRLEKQQNKKGTLSETEEQGFEIDSNQIIGLIKQNQWLEETFESLPYPEGAEKETWENFFGENISEMK